MFHAFILAAAIVAAPDASGASLVNIIRGELIQLRTGELTIPVHGANTRFAIPAEMRSKALELVGRRVVLECEYMSDRRWWVTSLEGATTTRTTAEQAARLEAARGLPRPPQTVSPVLPFAPEPPTVEAEAAKATAPPGLIVPKEE